MYALSHSNPAWTFSLLYFNYVIFVFSYLLCICMCNRWDEGTTNAAARGGYLKLLKWARSHSCPWDAKIISNAHKAGHQPVVAWARENGAPLSGNGLSEVLY